MTRALQRGENNECITLEALAKPLSWTLPQDERDERRQAGKGSASASSTGDESVPADPVMPSTLQKIDRGIYAGCFSIDLYVFHIYRTASYGSAVLWVDQFVDHVHAIARLSTEILRRAD